MKARLVVGMAALWLGACVQNPPVPEAPAAPPPPAPPTADQRFEALAARYLREFPEASPSYATALGDHRFDAQLEDVSAEAWQARLAFAERYLAELAAMDSAQFGRAHQVDYLLLRHQLEYEHWRLGTLAEWRWNPLVYSRIAGDSLYTLLARDFAPASERLKNLGARLEEIPRFLSQVRDVLDPARVPKVHAETAVRQNTGLLSMLDGEIARHIAALPAQEQEPLLASTAKAHTAIAQHQIWLEKRLVPEAAGEFRLGAEMYDRKLRGALFSSMSRDQIRSDAEAELATTHREMYDIARTILAGRRGSPPTPVVPTDAQRRRAIQAALALAYVDRPARDGVLDAARTALAETTKFVRAKNLVTVPDEPLEIIEMPEFQRGVALAYCDSPGPLEAGQKTFYAVSPIPADWTRAQTESFLREYNFLSIHDLTIHEAMPGHYLQLAHANRYPSPLRAVLGSSSFIEGWAVYAERLMVDQGYMNEDPLMRLIQLKWYLRSIVNALLDQAVHVDGMTRAQAMKLMTESGFQEEREAAAKWTRAQLTAAQLPVYFVGSREHAALRVEAEQRAQASFDLRQYHDRLLSYGSPPVRFARMLLFDLPIEE